MRRSELRRGEKGLTRRAGLKPGQHPLRARHQWRPKPKPSTLAYEAELDAITPAVVARSGGLCEARIPGICSSVAVLRHHRWRRSQRGPNTVENVLHLCDLCHRWIHLYVRIAKTAGFLLTPRTDPASVPWRPELLRKETS